MRREPGSKNERGLSSMRAQVTREWVGASQPLDLNKNISSASEHIEAILESIGIRGGLDEEEVKATWRVVAGELVAKQTEPVSLRKGCLTLKVLQPSMRYHLEQLKPGLLKKLQEKFGADNIKSLRLTIG